MINSKENWSEEKPSPKLSVKAVKNINEAGKHINYYGTMHTDAIVTSNKPDTNYFRKNVFPRHEQRTSLFEKGRISPHSELVRQNLKILQRRHEEKQAPELCVRVLRRQTILTNSKQQNSNRNLRVLGQQRFGTCNEGIEIDQRMTLRSIILNRSVMSHRIVEIIFMEWERETRLRLRKKERGSSNNNYKS